MFKKIIGYIIAFIGGAAALLGILAGRKRGGTADRIDDDIDRIRERQSEADRIVDDSIKQVKQAADKLSEANDIVDDSAGRIKTAKDILAELRRREAERNSTNGSG